MKKSQLLLTLTTWGSATFMIGFLVAGFLVIQLNTELPDAKSIRGVELKVPLRVYSADHQLISEFGNERRKPVDISEMPRDLINAVLSSEDDGFYEHQGIDLKGIFRAALSNFRSGTKRQGASTITQQVARNFFLSPEQTYTRKIKEVLLAIRLEQILSKDEILSLYLNKIFLGHRSYGFGAAADVYYDKELQELDLSQIAMLAGLPKAPSTYNPLRNTERAISRRNYVLSRLRDLEHINEADYLDAISKPISAEKHSKNSDLAAPHIAEMVRAQLIEQLGEGAYWQGLNVYTTIRAKEQIAANNSLRKGLQAYDRRHGFRGPIARIDLQNLTISAATNEAYDGFLAKYPSSQEQIPSLIVATDKEYASAYTRDHGTVKLSLKTSAWARRHLTANRVGDKPTSMASLVSIGDVVYVQAIVDQNSKAKETKSDKQDEKKAEQWRLSQVPNVSGALISIEPNTGKVLSLVGGYDFFLSKYNRAVQSIRQPGSNIKPFIYSASLDKGFTPATLISGAPIVITDPNHGTVWRPENYSGKFYGPTRMREALGKSMNLVSIRLLRSIGIPHARDYTARFGIDVKRFSSTLTMALGAGGATPLEVLSAYTVLANGGYKVKPYFIETITDRTGKEIFKAPKAQFCDVCYADYLPKPETQDNTGDQSTSDENQELIDSNETESIDHNALVSSNYKAPRVMSHANNFLTVSMLKDVVRRGTARKALTLERTDLAGKTGTTNDYVDAWFTGFNSKVATTVWVGFDNPTSMGRGEAGSLTALPIWIDYMRSGLQGIPQDSEELPDYIEEGFINRRTGKRTDELDPGAITEYFVIPELVPERALNPNFVDDLANGALDEALQKALIEDNSNLADESLGDSTKDGDLPSDKGAQDSFEIDPFSADSVDDLETEGRIIEEKEDTEGLF